MLINVNDAKAKDIATGDVVRVFNDRGEILVGALVTHHPRARHRHLLRRLALLSKRAFVSMAVSMS
nr:molybdopterin dinucleotide binding domain-containing protein [Campylobacter concisus]